MGAGMGASSRRCSPRAAHRSCCCTRFSWHLALPRPLTAFVCARPHFLLRSRNPQLPSPRSHLMLLACIAAAVKLQVGSGTCNQASVGRRLVSRGRAGAAPPPASGVGGPAGHGGHRVHRHAQVLPAQVALQHRQRGQRCRRHPAVPGRRKRLAPQRQVLEQRLQAGRRAAGRRRRPAGSGGERGPCSRAQYYRQQQQARAGPVCV